MLMQWCLNVVSRWLPNAMKRWNQWTYGKIFFMSFKIIHHFTISPLYRTFFCSPTSNDPEVQLAYYIIKEGEELTTRRAMSVYPLCMSTYTNRYKFSKDCSLSILSFDRHLWRKPKKKKKSLLLPCFWYIFTHARLTIFSLYTCHLIHHCLMQVGVY